MKHKIMGLVSLATAAALGSAPAHAATQDPKVTNGAACVPIVTGVGSTSAMTEVTTVGGRFSTQIVPGSVSSRALTFVCPLVRDDLNPAAVNLSVQVNTLNQPPAGTFTCKVRTVDETGVIFSESPDVVVPQGFSTKVLNTIPALLPDHAYVLTCVVPNVDGGQRSGIISYKWTELSF
jgi:hypothetical protein